jgi:hypothetical protein
LLRSLLIVVVIAGYLVSCETPQLPSLNANLTVPLTTEHYDIYRLKKDLENSKDSLELAIVSDSVLLTINHDERVIIGEHLDADPTVDSTNGVISNDLKLKDSVTTTFSLGLLGPGSIDALHNTTVTIPAFNIPQRNRTASFNNFTAATVLNGSTIRTTITNNTQANFDSLTIVIIGQNLVRVDSFKIAVNTGGTQNQTRTFSSTTTITTPLTVRVFGHSTGSTGNVLVDTSRAVSVKLVADVTGSSITGRFPSQTVTRVDSFKSSSNSVIDSGYIETGKITLNFTNLGLPVNAWLFFSSSDFDSAGIKLNRTIRVPTASSVIIELDEWKIVPSTSAIGNQYLNYQYVIRTDSVPASATPTTIANGQGIKVKATLDTLKFSRLRAKLAQEQVDLDRTSQYIDIKHLDSIQIKRAFFEIITDHRIPFPISLDITITGKKLPNTTKTAHIFANIPAYTSGTSRKDTVQTTNFDSVAALLNLLPDSIIVTGNVFVGDNITTGVVNREDFINAQINLRAPLIFELYGDSTSNLVKTDPSLMDLSPNDKEKLYDRLKSVIITGKIRNHFPVPISVQFFIDSSSVDPPTEIRFYDSTSAVKFVYPYSPLTISKGETNLSGIVTVAEDTTINYELDQSEYQRIFDSSIDSVNAKLFRGLKVKLLNTGASVQVSSSDYIDVNASVEFEYFIGEDNND